MRACTHAGKAVDQVVEAIEAAGEQHRRRVSTATLNLVRFCVSLSACVCACVCVYLCVCVPEFLWGCVGGCGCGCGCGCALQGRATWQMRLQPWAL